jgi:formylmethanofuran dehydrogenase subunit E
MCDCTYYYEESDTNWRECNHPDKNICPDDICPFDLVECDKCGELFYPQDSDYLCQKCLSKINNEERI